MDQSSSLCLWGSVYPPPLPPCYFIELSIPVATSTTFLQVCITLALDKAVEKSKPCDPLLPVQTTERGGRILHTCLHFSEILCLFTFPRGLPSGMAEMLAVYKFIKYQPKPVVRITVGPVFNRRHVRKNEGRDSEKPIPVHHFNESMERPVPPKRVKWAACSRIREEPDCVMPGRWRKWSRNNPSQFRE